MKMEGAATKMKMRPYKKNELSLCKKMFMIDVIESMKEEST
jgi:hypothetical protein